MNLKILDNTKQFILLFAFLAFIIGGCSSDKKKNSENEGELTEGFNSELDDDLVDKYCKKNLLFSALTT